MDRVLGVPRHEIRRWPFLILAYVSIVLAGAGVILPGLPTTPFVLLAAWGASRGSDRLHVWLYNHRHFGPPLKDWAEQRAVSVRAKVTALVLLVLSWIILAGGSDTVVTPLLSAVFFSLVALFLVTRPSPRRTGPRPQAEDDRHRPG